MSVTFKDITIYILYLQDGFYLFEEKSKALTSVTLYQISRLFALEVFHLKEELIPAWKEFPNEVASLIESDIFTVEKGQNLFEPPTIVTFLKYIRSYCMKIAGKKGNFSSIIIPDEVKEERDRFMLEKLTLESTMKQQVRKTRYTELTKRAIVSWI